ncbi:HugZ family protein [Rhizobium sp. TRM95796]|uniref:HugZ family pyridoxamine 5'-phosphate oxidase n=1 Tax=Rhizobium sp. TRM95796 TaxID=2979862 RepID=UPI0021E924B6|nr:pyridoxamine 5'-phosphate oxidase family protein [Rhizobium sp. TRM95796]MCV3764886.1 pyridoxamine 5'-phosphate oxidase family protein [Rhizobium sp. TRM95796]
MQEETPLIRPTDEEARKLARTLLRGARYGALAVLDPETGFPLATRTLVGADLDGAPILLISHLATHTKALMADPRCSLLVGEPRKGDPLAWPRLTVTGVVRKVEKGSEEENVIRRRFLRRHPKSKLYASFEDFQFHRIELGDGFLNGGFGKSYNILRGDLLIHSSLTSDIAANELYYLSQVASLDPDLANLLANAYSHVKSYNWELAGIDACGMELSHGEHLVRIELEEAAQDLKGLIASYEKMLMEIREN